MKPTFCGPRPPYLGRRRRRLRLARLLFWLAFAIVVSLLVMRFHGVVP